jgi:hypothetical protein
MNFVFMCVRLYVYEFCIQGVCVCVCVCMCVNDNGTRRAYIRSMAPDSVCVCVCVCVHFPCSGFVCKDETCLR